MPDDAGLDVCCAVAGPSGDDLLFPDDGSDPIGIPKPKDKSQEKKEVVKAKKKVKFFNKLFKMLKGREGAGE